MDEFLGYWMRCPYPEIRVNLLHNLLKGTDGLDAVEPPEKVTFFMAVVEESLGTAHDCGACREDESRLWRRALDFALTTSWDEKRSRFAVTSATLIQLLKRLGEDRIYSDNMSRTTFAAEPYRRHTIAFLERIYHRREEIFREGKGLHLWHRAVIASGNPELFEQLCPKDLLVVDLILQKLKEINRPISIDGAQFSNDFHLSALLNWATHPNLHVHRIGTSYRLAQALVLHAGRCGRLNEMFSLVEQPNI